MPLHQSIAQGLNLMPFCFIPGGMRMSISVTFIVSRARAAWRALPVLVALLALCAGGASAQTAPCKPEAAQAVMPGGIVHYLKTGEGPRVVLLHGLFAQKEQWVPVMCLVAADGYSVIAPDLPGFGQSVGFSIQDYRLENQVELLHTLVAGLGIKEFHLAGNSMGGAIAGLYQHRYSQEVRSLAFIGAPLGVVDWSPRLGAALEKGINPFIPVTPEQFDLELHLLFYQPPTVPADVVASLVNGYKVNHDFYSAVFKVVAGYLRALVDAGPGSVRALALWGDEDGIFDVSGLEKLSALYPGLDARRVERTGHLPMVEHPEDTA